MSTPDSTDDPGGTAQGKTAVVLCQCSGIITEKLDWDEVKRRIGDNAANPVYRTDELACASDNLEALAEWLREEKPDRVVIAACSPRDHQGTFQGLMSSAGLNPYLVQLVNVREQLAWVTDAEAAAGKATRLLKGALARVREQTPMEERSIPVRTDVLVVGSGPAGQQAAMTLARAGRTVTLVEKEPMIGGLPVRFEELFPDMECGPCLLEPLMDDMLQGAGAEHVNLLTLAEVTEVKGSFGNWIVAVRQQPRRVTDACIGCMMCVEACPAKRVNAWNRGGELAAIDVPFMGALPNLPFVDEGTCLALNGQECDACVTACPVEGAVNLADAGRDLTIECGAIIVATGASEKQDLVAPFAGLPEVHTAYTFERLLSVNGHTMGDIVKTDGEKPGSLAIVQCAGSLDGDARYCSGVCCQSSIKYAHMVAKKEPEMAVSRLVREVAVPGVGAATLAGHDHATVVRYGGLGELAVEGDAADRVIVTSSGERIKAEMIVVVRPVVPSTGTIAMARLLELGTDWAGFIAPLHGTASSCTSPLRGIYLAGACRGPSDIREAFASGTAAAGLALSDLVEGRDLVISPQVAVVHQEGCSGCRTCLPVCPYRAISWDTGRNIAEIADFLCMGCGTCVAACPSGAIIGRGFSRDILRAELGGVLA